MINILKYIAILTLFGLLMASPAWAGQRICAEPAAESTRALFLPDHMQNTLVARGEPKVRFIIRFDWPCRKGHLYKEAGTEPERIPLGFCFHSGKAHISVRQGCGDFEIDAQPRSRGRR